MCLSLTLFLIKVKSPWKSPFSLHFSNMFPNISAEKSVLAHQRELLQGRPQFLGHLHGFVVQSVLAEQLMGNMAEMMGLVVD